MNRKHTAAICEIHHDPEIIQNNKQWNFVDAELRNMRNALMYEKCISSLGLDKHITLHLPSFLCIPWASYQIRKIAGCACAGNIGNVFSAHRLQRKPLVSNPGMHHGTCVTHVPWCMSGSLTCGGGENVPGIPGACATRNFTFLVRGPLRCIWFMCCCW